MTIWQISGDGDGLAIGGNHFIHAVRRNIDLNVKMLDSFNGKDQMVAPAILGAAGNCYAQLGLLTLTTIFPLPTEIICTFVRNL